MPVCVVNDPNRLRQVVANVVGNAIKFTHQGGVTATVDYDRNTSRLSIAVMDTGIGIPKEKQDKLFVPFYQVESSASREFGGTGLGLAISRNLLRLLDGSLAVSSEEGQGSEFTITLTAQRLETDPPFENQPSLHTLLLVDEPIAQSALQRQLGEWGISLDCRNSKPVPIGKTLASGNYELLLVAPSAARPDTIRTIIDARAEMQENLPQIIRFVSSDLDSELVHSETCKSTARPISLRKLNRLINSATAKPARVFKKEWVGIENAERTTKFLRHLQRQRMRSSQHPLTRIVAPTVLLPTNSHSHYRGRGQSNQHQDSSQIPEEARLYSGNCRKRRGRGCCSRIDDLRRSSVAKPARLLEIKGVLTRAYQWQVVQAAEYN
ncbi:ATP-binding protein [Pelagicoccus sp. SDUM812002]|uniref:ATP-binding protein n=1 Tax=Pelagicoccus sp. SDUM812002 TaxID=3041266 RepID=UPI00280CD8F2|nr:ATP-binding protein [Pelagicoccus sp. SDUM812002]MDQ8186695.1 ATP-binding protein [Pelagicoccus sp. SDUM812002]